MSAQKQKKPPQVIVYLKNDKQKALVKRVADQLGMPDAKLMRAVALPTVRKLAVLLKRGVDAGKLREKIEGRA